jgi:integrating conjugative element protein (TIGR03757 family)
VGTTTQNPRANIARRIGSRVFAPITNDINRIALSVAVVFALSAGSVAQEATGVHPRLIEMFTTSEFPVRVNTALRAQSDMRKVELHVFELDGLQRIEAALSEGLTADPAQARRTALERIQHLDNAARTRMQGAAMGLAKAAQYGINRYPAIVFNGRAVVYGLTDLHQVLQHFRVWRNGAGP